LISLIVLILGPIVRAVYPEAYSPDRIIPPEPYPDASAFNNVTHSEPHPLCSQSVGHWSLMQLAAIPILVEASEHPEVIEYLSHLTNVPVNKSLSARSLVSRALGDEKLAIGLQAIPYLHEIGIYLENVLMDYYLEIAAAAPYFETAYDLFLQPVLRPIAEYLLSGIVGPNRLSVYYLDQAKVTATLEMATVYEILEVLHSPVDMPVIVGHGANGLLAKALPLSIDAWRFSFEGPKLKDSPMGTLADADEESDTSRIMNFYTGESFTANADESALTNNRIPKYRSGIRSAVPPQPFQTFCFVVAACESDDRFDEICVGVLGNSTYLGLWEKLGRSRAPKAKQTVTERLDDLRDQIASILG
jgi:hypothetical protein